MIRLMNLVCNSSDKSSQLIKPILLTPPHHHTCQFIKKYSQHKGGEQEEIGKERAPSTLEVMEKFSHEKEERISDEKFHQTFGSHTSDKMMDSAKQAIGGDDADDEHKFVKKKKK